MEKEIKLSNENEGSYAAEHEAILNYSTGPTIMNMEWAQEGDFFQQVSTYNHNYIAVRTLGSTTLINP